VKVQPGVTVARGETLLVIESMKLEHSLAAARDAVIKTIHVEPGQQAATSQVLVTFEPSA
jgi:3-methylcrotonyl-CoA carboxylase alpha subunit/geranyl-CoA carboxylase alpha subunit